MMVTTHVVDVSIESGAGRHTNKNIADQGGGQYDVVTDPDPAGLLSQLLEVVDVKAGSTWVPDLCDQCRRVGVGRIARTSKNEAAPEGPRGPAPARLHLSSCRRN